MCQFNLTCFSNTIDCPYIVEDKFSKIFENNAIFDIYRDILDETENKYYYVLFVRVPAVVMVTVVVENEVGGIEFEIGIEIQIQIQIQIEIAINIAIKSQPAVSDSIPPVHITIEIENKIEITI